MASTVTCGRHGDVPRQEAELQLPTRHGWRVEDVVGLDDDGDLGGGLTRTIRVTAATSVAAARSDLAGGADDVDDFSLSLARAAPMAAAVSTWTSARAERLMAEASTSALA